MVATPCRKETSYDTYLGYEGLISVSRKHYLRYEGLPHPLNMPYDTVIPPFVRVSYRAVTTSPAPRNADRCSETLKSAPRNAETTPEGHIQPSEQGILREVVICGIERGGGWLERGDAFIG